MIIIPVCPALVKSCSPVEAYRSSVKNWNEPCRHCGSSMCRDGSFNRLTPKEIGPFRVQQVRCSQGDKCPGDGPRKQSLIPSWVLPYQRHPVGVQEKVLQEVNDGECTVEDAAERARVEPKTVSRWLGRWRMTIKELQGRICRLLASTGELTYWVVDGTVRGCSASRKFFQQLQLLRRLRCPGFPGCCLVFLCWLWPRAFLPKGQTVLSRFPPEHLAAMM